MKEEKVWFENSKGQKLSGVLHQSNSKSIVIISHGFAANKNRPRLLKLAHKLAKNNVNALRFDFGGSGESEKRPVTVEDQVYDLNSVINYSISEGYTHIGLLGESLGGLASILAYSSRIKTMVLCAPVTKAKIHYWAKTQKFIDEINKKGYLSYEKDERVFEIPKQYLDERASVNQREILTKIKCPTLIIHGSSDDAIPIENSKEAMQYLPPSSKLEILKGGHHTLNKKTDEVISLAVNWFNKYLK